MTFQELQSKREELKQITMAVSTVSDDEYWDKREEFKSFLNAALNDKFLMKGLTKAQLLTFIEWCSTFRPREPHVLLNTLSKLRD